MRALYNDVHRPARVAIFLSGTGSNARRLLSEHVRAGGDSPIEPVCLLTDAPSSPHCGAKALGETFGVPVVGLDIRRFYRQRGVDRVTLKTAEGRRIRAAWTEELRRVLAPYRVDLGAFAGFEPLTNIVEDFPCINVHPGDLTYLKEGKRYLVGLHTVPVERAIMEGLSELRSSVIVATPFHGEGADMDTGPLLGISEPVPVDLKGHTLAELIRAERGPPEAAAGWAARGLLREIAAWNQNRLKEHGDWVIFPQVLFHVARGHYAVGEDNTVYFRPSVTHNFKPVRRIVFGENSCEVTWAP